MTAALSVVVIDPNVRVRGHQTFTSIDAADGPLTVGGPVICREVEDGIDWDGKVTDIDESHGIVYIAVDWATGRDAT